MAARKVIVKVPDSIENLGSMDVLCTDKTGTLTEDRIVLQRHLDIEGKPSQLALIIGYLNSMHSTGVRNTMDDAVIGAMNKSTGTALPAYGYQRDTFDFDDADCR